MNLKNLQSLLWGSRINKGIVPNINADMLNSQNDPKSVEFESPTTRKSAKTAIGGSLYASLLAASETLAPSVILSTAAVASRIAISRKAKKGKRSKRSRRRKN